MLDDTGIDLDERKRTFLASRLANRLAILNLPSYADYYRLITQPDNEAERFQAIDLLTTHETWFFREDKHFDTLRATALAHREPRPLRVWSAACASGEEAYSIAMVLADVLGIAPYRWELLASDISVSGLDVARHGRYPLSRAEPVPLPLLQKYCLKGVRSAEGTFMVSKRLRACVRFELINLAKPLPTLPAFDIVFLRNTLIYFRPTARQQILKTIESRILPGGLLFVSHTESLQGLSSRFSMLRPGIYRNRKGNA